MPRSTAQPTRLLSRQTRVIHASEGWRLQAVSGRLWITQPNAVQDLFLTAGGSVELRQDGVVVEADVEPGGSAAGCSYVLLPLVAGGSSHAAVPKGLRVSRWMRRIVSGFKRFGLFVSPTRISP